MDPVLDNCSCGLRRGHYRGRPWKPKAFVVAAPGLRLTRQWVILNAAASVKMFSLWCTEDDSIRISISDSNMINCTCTPMWCKLATASVWKIPWFRCCAHQCSLAVKDPVLPFSQNISRFYICSCVFFFLVRPWNFNFPFHFLEAAIEAEWVNDFMIIYCSRSPQWCQWASSFQHQNTRWRRFQRDPAALCRRFHCLPVYFLFVLLFLSTSNMYFGGTSRDTVQHTVSALGDSVQAHSAHSVLIH